MLKTFFFVYLGISLELISGSLITIVLVLTVLAFALRIPAVKLSASKSFPIKDISVMAIMVPKGLAAVVLASIPFQQGIIGGELIQNIVYGVVLLSIVITAILIILIDKTQLSAIYAWFLRPGLPEMPLRKSLFSKPEKVSHFGDKVDYKTSKITPSGTKLFGSSEKDNPKS